MIKEKKSLKGKIPSRRKFFKAAAATGAAATAAVAMPNIAFGAPQTLKMQAAWPSGANIFFEMAGDYCKMVSDMSGGSLKIDLQPVGAVVKTSEIGQAVRILENEMEPRLCSVIHMLGLPARPS